MKFSIYFVVSIIVVLLFLASAISLLFALVDKNTSPLMLTALANMVAAILLAFLISRGILTPLSQARDIIKKVGEGNLDLKIAPSQVKELQELADELNAMVENIRREKEAIDESKAALEIRVKARTEQLQELAESLEGKVQKRTKELQDKVGELERFQKLAVGRELQMIELKKQVEALQRKT